ncbi:MAG: hypothetical protein ABSA54_01265 [Terriglobales bacterium]|jgi:hypothetical protein
MKTIGNLILALLLVSSAHAAEDVVSAVHGTVQKVDSATRTIVVRAGDGTEHSLHFLDRTVVHGADDSAKATKESWHGLKEGTEVVAHYSARGAEDTALEFDKVGKGGLKTVDGSVKDIDRGRKTLIVKTSDGIESTFRLTDHAAKDGGKDIAEGIAKGRKVTVYYSEDAGVKVAHFFEKA